MPLETVSPQLAPATLHDVRSALRRRRSVVLAGVLLGALLGVLAVALVPTGTPTATVGVELRATGIDPSQPQGRTSAALDVDRRIVEMTSDDVLQRAVEDHGSPLGADELRASARVRQVGTLPLVRITVTNESPEIAVAAVNAVAEAALDAAREAAEAVRDSHDRLFREQLDELYAEIGALGAAIGEAEEAARLARLAAGGDDEALDEDGEPLPVDPLAAARAAALEGQRDASLRRATELERSRAALITHNVDPGTIVESARADVPDAPLGVGVAVPAAALFGLLVGIALALVLDRFDRRLWTPEDVARVTGSSRVIHVDRMDLVGDGLRTGGGHRRLRTLVAPRERPGTVLLTSMDAEMGSAIAAGLCSAIAGAGRPVLLVDLTDNDAFGLPSGDVDGWLRGRVGLEKAARSPAGVAGLRVLRGRTGSELAGSSTLAQLLEAPAGAVVLHVPGGSDSGDVLALASQVDSVVLVVSARRDKADDVARTARWLDRDAREAPVLVLAG